jgi:hypothetical protein
MTTVLLVGVGDLGGWALEFLARSPGVDRIVTTKRSPWVAASKADLAMLGSAFQGHYKRFDHYPADLADEEGMVRLLADVRPDVIIHSATVQSPRVFMNADVDPGLRAAIRAATFSLWLPWHLLPASRLVRAVHRAGIETGIVNTCFPDVVNQALWNHFGHGPIAGAGNVEVSAATVLRYAMEVTGLPAAAIEVSLVGSHALMAYGAARVPHHFRIEIEGRDETAGYDLAPILSSWPSRIDWGRTAWFSLFGASAVKNALALVGSEPVRTHVSGPMGLPGGYPAVISDGRVDLDLPAPLTRDEAVAINNEAARFDAIERIESDGTVVYTREALGAMENLGYRCEAVEFEDLADRCRILQDLYRRLVTRSESRA